MKYRLKKPMVTDVDAIQVTKSLFDKDEKGIMEEIKSFIPETAKVKKGCLYFFIYAFGFTTGISINDWIIKEAEGDLSICKPDIFEATYEKVEEE